MKKTILITGANGMLAKHLANQLEAEYNIRFLTRKPFRKNDFFWDVEQKTIDSKALKGVHTIIHLAGAGIADKRWTTSRKQLILSSRIDSAALILERLKENNLTINTFISASATGFYGAVTTNQVFNEESPNGSDFLGKICAQWEAIAHDFEFNDVASRIAIIRIGIILDKKGGALKKIIQPIKYGIGSGIGSGKQYMPWIHINDLSNIFNFVISNKHINGVFNAVAPDQITNIDLTRKIGKLIHRPILFPNIPSLLLKLIFGEMAIIVLHGSQVSSEKIIKAGFKFQYENINKALSNLI